MKKFFATVVALFCVQICGAHEGPDSGAGQLQERLMLERSDLTFENGQLVSTTFQNKTTKYEYVRGKVSRKVLPSGVTVDYFYGRDGKVTETRFSNGLVRNVHYDRATGLMTKISGSDGFELLVVGQKNADTRVVLTGPGNFNVDLTSQLAKAPKRTYKFTRAKLSTPMPTLIGTDDGGCSPSDYQTGGLGFCDWEGGDWGSGGGTPPPDRTFERCMSMICDPANITFHRYCNSEPIHKQSECKAAAQREYFACYQSCR